MNVNETPVTTSARTPVRQLSVILDNRVGTLMALVRLLNEHHIEVLGLSLQESAEITLLRIVPSDPESAQTLFMERGISHTECPVIVVELHESATNLNHCLGALLAAEVNIRQSYSLLARPNNWPLLALHVDDTEVGMDALHQAGFKVLTQGDLSR